jgi:hypothetical protein
VEDVFLLVRLVGDPREVVEAAHDLHLVRAKRSLHPEGAARPTLAFEAVTDGDDERIAVDFEP